MWGSALSSGPAALRAAAVLEGKEVKFPWKLPSSSSSDACISIHAHMPCYFLIWQKPHLLSGCYAVCNARCLHFFSTTVWHGSALLVILIKVLVTNMRVFMKAQWEVIQDTLFSSRLKGGSSLSLYDSFLLLYILCKHKLFHVWLLCSSCGCSHTYTIYKLKIAKSLQFHLPGPVSNLTWWQKMLPCQQCAVQGLE